jgi:hypothetical protein
VPDVESGVASGDDGGDGDGDGDGELALLLLPMPGIDSSLD